LGKSESDLAALIGSRICHDLISPIGAINNGLELLGMTGTTAGAELELISTSVENASARIRFFRIAYGAAGAQEVGRAEIVSTLKDYSAGARCEMVWGPLEPVPRRALRLAFLGIQCLETALPYGGRIEVRLDAERWVITGLAEKLNVDAPLWARLPGGEAEVRAAPVQFALPPVLAAEGGRTVSYDAGAAEIGLRV